MQPAEGGGQRRGADMVLALPRSSAWVDPRTPHPADDQGRHKQMIDPVAEPGRAAECLVPAVRHDQRHGTRRRSLPRRLLRGVGAEQEIVD